MNKEQDKLKVALVGAYPPPYGGVSIHIQRLQSLLSDNSIQCVIYDVTPFIKNTPGIVSLRRIKNWRRFFNSPEEVVHIHKSEVNLKKVLPLLALLKFRGKKVIITYHSLRGDVEHFNWFKRKAMQITFSIASHQIAVSPEIKTKLLSLGTSPETISVIPAFLPPSIKQWEIDEIPQEVWDFIERHAPVISANAFKIVFYNNQDLYGIDLCIDLCANLKNSYHKIGFIFCLPNIGDYDYLHKMEQKITEKGIENNFLFVTQPYQFYPILMKSRVFVRPTNTDGDAVSVREALYFKIPVVASNIVPRPEGTILFKNRDIDDFTLKVKDLLSNYEQHKKELESVEIEDNSQKLIKIYQKLLSHNG